MKSMRQRLIGLHLRCNTSIIDILQKAVRLDLSFFQCFLRQQAGPIIDMSSQEIALWRAAAVRYKHIFVHASYRINIANYDFDYHPALKQELYWAQKLGCTHMVLHPGSYTIYDNGIDSIVRMLNSLMRSSTNIAFVLENVAFAAPSIGGNIADLKSIKDKLDCPDRIGFCIDTAHAYAYGYNLVDAADRSGFIQMLGEFLGFDSIVLIHTNDTQSGLACRHDIHCSLGSGNIGVDALREFVLDERLWDIPLLLELPVLEESQECHDLAVVKSWHYE